MTTRPGIRRCWTRSRTDPAWAGQAWCLAWVPSVPACSWSRTHSQSVSSASGWRSCSTRTATGSWVLRSHVPCGTGTRSTADPRPTTSHASGHGRWVALAAPARPCRRWRGRGRRTTAVGPGDRDAALTVQDPESDLAGLDGLEDVVLLARQPERLDRLRLGLPLPHLVLLGLDLDLGGAHVLERRRDRRGDIHPLDHEGRITALTARSERGRAEEPLPQGGLEPLGQLGLDVVLQLDEQIGVADQVGHGHVPGLLLEGVLDLLAERVLDELVPPTGCVRLVPEAELLVEVAQLVGVQLEVHRDLVGDVHAVA